MKRLPDLTRTAKALDAFDAADAAYKALDVATTPNATLIAKLDALDELAADVGAAFGLDTADRNNVDDCVALVRPCSKGNAGGESFVRRMVRQWREGDE